MSTTRRTIAAPPERVWAVLADADNYAHWVVGARDIRDADPGFPAVGTSFKHTLGLGPIDLKDESDVVESDPPRRLVLHVKARPLGRGVVALDLVPEGAGTLVTMREGPASLLARLMYNPIADRALHGRNAESLRRLAELAEGRAPEPSTSGNSSRVEGGPAVGPDG